MPPLALAASIASAAAIGLAMWVLYPPPTRLVRRVLPYLNPTVTTRVSGHQGFLGRVFGPMIDQAATWVSGLVERRGTDHTLLRLRQAGWFPRMADDEVLVAYRHSQLRGVVVGAFAGFILGQLLDLPLTASIALGVLGFVIGLTRPKARLERAIEDRRERMRIEIYTVNQLLAMRVRAGGGVIGAVQSIVDRGQGAVVEDLSQALRLHRSGWRGPEAFRRIAEITPEPFCSRTYRLLASAEERGSDLASSLLALSEDVRETRRESIKRSATKRRAAMLVPTIAVLAPVLIIFVAAPLPFLITGWQ